MMAMFVYLLPCCHFTVGFSLANQPIFDGIENDQPSYSAFIPAKRTRSPYLDKRPVHLSSARPEKKMMIRRQAFLFEIADCFRGRCLLNFQEFYWGKWVLLKNLEKRVGKKNWKAIRSFQTEGKSNSTCALRNKCCWETLGKYIISIQKKGITSHK